MWPSLDDIDSKISAWQLIHRARLNHRELKLLLWRFGFLGGALIQREIAAEFGISTARVAQIEWKVLNKLRLAAGVKPIRKQQTWYEPPPLLLWEGPSVVIPVLLGSNPPGIWTWTSP